MPSSINMRFNRGVRTSMDPAHLRSGEMTEGSGIYYRTGDGRRAHKIGGRTNFGNAFHGINPVRGLYLAQFGGGTDYLLAEVDDAITYSPADPDAVHGFQAAGLVESLPITGRMYGAHALGRHYIVNGNMAMMCLESDLSTHDAGLSSPSEAPTVQTAAVTVPSPLPRPSTATPEVLAGQPEWVNPSRIYDLDDESAQAFASLTILRVATHAKLTASGFSPDMTSGRVLQVTFAVFGAQGQTGEGGGGGGGGQGGGGGGGTPTPKGGFNITVNIQYRTSLTGTWQDLLVQSNITAKLGKHTAQVPITADSADVEVRMWPEYVSGNSQAVLQWYDVSITTATAATFSTTSGYRIAYTEFDATRNEESPQSPDSSLIEMASENTAVYTFPSTATNSRSTHRRIYRLPDGGAAPHQYGLLAVIPIDETTYTDLFAIGLDVQLTPLLRLVNITDPESGGTVRFPADTPPPLLSHLNVYSGSLVGVTPEGDVRYSIKGAPNSWPEIYVLDDLPFQENDLALATATIGNTLVIAATEIIMAREGIPRAEDGTINRSPTRAITGHPGCVAAAALAAYAVDGASRVAWVSRYGVHETDGHTGRVLSKALDWDATVGTTAALDTAQLHFDPRRRLLYFALDTDGDGVNDRYWTAHMAADMRDDDGLPLWTGPHYGKIASMASGQVEGTYRLWTGHAVNGLVYLEDSDTQDPSLSYDETTTAHPLIATSGRVYDEQNRKRLMVLTATIRHSDAGANQTAEVTWTAGMDDDQTVQTLTETISFSGSGQENVLIGLAGDWHQVSITHLGSSPLLSPLSLEGVNAEVDVMGRTGHVGVY